MMRAAGFHSNIIQQGRLLQGILGLRGIAALAVVLFHIVHLAGIQVPPGFYFIESDFGTAPFLFFVLSAFSLMYSTEHTMHRPDWAREYLVKRFFRIAPLFYSVLALMVALMVRHAIISHSPLPAASTVFLNMTFLFGFFPELEVGLVQAGWTVGVEMVFYVLFPVLLMTLKTGRQALLFFLAAVLVGYAARAELHGFYLEAAPQSRWDWASFAFLPNLYFFAAGILAFRFEQEQKKRGRPLHVLVPLVALSSIAVLLHFEPGPALINPGPFSQITMAIGFGALCVWQSAKPNRWFANRLFEYLGERSFSIYLLHPLVIYVSRSWVAGLYAALAAHIGAYAYFACAVLVVAEVLVLAEMSYRAIEVPGIRLGHRLIDAMRGKAAQAR